MSDVAAALQNDVDTLANLMASVELQPAGIANGAVELLNEVSASKITGRGGALLAPRPARLRRQRRRAKAAFDAVKPLLTGSNAALASQIDTRFAGVDTALAAYKVGTGTCLQRAHADRHQEALAGDRRAGRAALEGREADRQAVTVTTGSSEAGRASSSAAVPRHRRCAHRDRGDRERRRHRPRAGAPAAAPRATARGRGPVPRRAPGRDRHARAGPPAVRDLRPHDHRPRRRVDLLKQWTSAARQHDRRPSRRERQHRPGRTARRHRRGGRPRAVVVDDHVRVRSLAVHPRRRRPFGVAAQRPAALVDIPEFGGDTIDPARSDGDLAVQACSNDPNVCFHAIRNLARIARQRGAAVVADGLRAHVEHRHRADHAAQPHGLQGRHQQRHRRGHRRAAQGHLGRRRTTARRGWPRAPTWSRGASACCSRCGTARRSPTRSSRSGATRSRARRSARRRSTTPST